MKVFLIICFFSSFIFADKFVDAEFSSFLLFGQDTKNSLEKYSEKDYSMVGLGVGLDENLFKRKGFGINVSESVDFMVYDFLLHSNWKLSSSISYKALELFYDIEVLNKNITINSIGTGYGVKIKPKIINNFWGLYISYSELEDYYLKNNINDKSPKLEIIKIGLLYGFPIY